MIITQQTVLLASIPGAVALAEIGLLVYFIRFYQKTITIRFFILVIAGTILWVGSNAIAALSATGDISFFERFAYLGGTLLTTSFLVFVYAFPYPKSQFIQTLQYLPIVSSIFFGYLVFFTDTFFSKITIDHGVSTMVRQGLSLYVWTAFFMVVWFLAVRELVRRYRESVADVRQRLRYLLIGVGISLFVGVISDVIMPLITKRDYLTVASSFSVVWLIFIIKGIRYQGKAV